MNGDEIENKSNLYWEMKGFFFTTCGLLLSFTCFVSSSSSCRPYALFVGFGTHGDLQPLVNMANFSQARKMRVVLATSTTTEYRNSLSNTFDLVSSLGDIDEMVSSLSWIGSRRTSIFDTGDVLREIVELYPAAMTELENLVAREQCLPNLVVGSLLTSWAADFAERHRVPFVNLNINHLDTPREPFSLASLSDLVTCLPAIVKMVSYRSGLKPWPQNLAAFTTIWASFPPIIAPHRVISPRAVIVGSLATKGAVEGRDQEQVMHWLDDSGSKMVIVVSFGTVNRPRKEFLCKTLEALETLPEGFRVLWGTTVSHDTLMLNCPAPKRCHAVKWIPQVAVLGHKSVAVFVSHVGAGSIQQGLSSGVPMIAIPFANDQFDNADALEKSGAGLKLDPFADNFSSLLLRETIVKVASNTSFRASARQIAHRHSTLGGLDRAFEILVNEMEGRPYFPFEYEPTAQVAHTWIILTSCLWVIAILINKFCVCCCCDLANICIP